MTTCCRVRQVLINLVGNAVKFTAAGAVSVTCSGERTNGAWLVTLSVRDTGPGVATEDIDRIFGAFEQAAPGAAAGGTGLGLAISRELANFRYGDIAIASRP